MGKAVFYNGEFYVLGGETLDGSGATPANVYNRVDIYDPGSNTWRLGPVMATARHGIFPVLHAGRIYIAGGGVQAGGSQSATLEIYNALPADLGAAVRSSFRRAAYPVAEGRPAAPDYPQSNNSAIENSPPSGIALTLASCGMPGGAGADGHASYSPAGVANLAPAEAYPESSSHGSGASPDRTAFHGLNDFAHESLLNPPFQTLDHKPG
jgi:hypothetical protein